MAHEHTAATRRDLFNDGKMIIENCKCGAVKSQSTGNEWLVKPVQTEAQRRQAAYSRLQNEGYSDGPDAHDPEDAFDVAGAE